MIRVLSIIAVAALSVAPTFAQGLSGSAASQPHEIVGAAVAASRTRTLDNSPEPGHVSAAPTKGSYINGQIISASNSPTGTHARLNVSVRNSTEPVALKTRPRTMPPPPPTATRAVPVANSLTQVYRVGIGDVLDVQIADMPTGKSTLFTVLEGGKLDYPLASEALNVSGLTTDQIAAQLTSHIKVLDNPRVLVKVRDFASHSVTITGLVANPGVKFLRRENIPLFVILTEAQPYSEAGRITITRAGQPLITVDLRDQRSASTLVVAGDTLKVLTAAPELNGFFYTGGAVNSPGQKTFYSGMTLTQAILASGGVTRSANPKVKLQRQGTDGLLVTSEYNVKEIENGKSPDPMLQRGDRITVPEQR